MRLAAYLSVSTFLIFVSAVSNCTSTEDGVIVWGSSGCSNNDDCSEGECCVSRNGETECEQLSGIGQTCFLSTEQGTLSEGCPCQADFQCTDKGQGLAICERPRYQHF
uniref:Putative toxin-like peptide n=1 Tax=Amblyomma tuberculatum TaxID=48802 RepID=A0A6M2E5L1_9ACAR